MRITSKGEYGLRALFDLAQHYGQGPVQSDEIAARQGIWPNYLNQILIILRKGGLVESVRGPQGGHLLARPPEQITLLEALTVLEGPLVPSDLARDGAPASVPQDLELVREVWRELRSAIESYLRSATLDDLCQRKRQRDGQVMYYI